MESRVVELEELDRDHDRDCAPVLIPNLSCCWISGSDEHVNHRSSQRHEAATRHRLGE